MVFNGNHILMDEIIGGVLMSEARQVIKHAREWAAEHWSNGERYSQPFEDVLAEWSTIEFDVGGAASEVLYNFRRYQSYREWFDKLSENMKESAAFVKVYTDKAAVRVSPGCYIKWCQDRFIITESLSSTAAVELGTVILRPAFCGAMERGELVPVVCSALSEILLHTCSYCAVMKKVWNKCNPLIQAIVETVCDADKWEEWQESMWDNCLGRYIPPHDESAFIMGNNTEECVMTFFIGGKYSLTVEYFDGEYYRHSTVVLDIPQCIRGSAEYTATYVHSILVGFAAWAFVDITYPRITIRDDSVVWYGESPNVTDANMCHNAQELYNSLLTYFNGQM